jgi:nucleotide-binding universal stress UspA family protein
MKMLVCVDGSDHSNKALEKALIFAENPHVDEVALIHVFEGHLEYSASAFGAEGYSVTEEDLNRLKKMYEEQKEMKEKVLNEAKKPFTAKNINVKTIMEEGHPAHVIVSVAEEQGYDIIVLGSRGLSGLKKILLGSVSNAVVQEVNNCCVLVVR